MVMSPIKTKVVQEKQKKVVQDNRIDVEDRKRWQSQIKAKIANLGSPG